LDGLTEYLLSARLSALIRESPRLRGVLVQLCESKHVGSFRGRLQHRDLYARIGKTHFDQGYMERVTGQAKVGFRALQKDFARNLKNQVRDYSRLSQKYRAAQARVLSGETNRGRPLGHRSRLHAKTVEMRSVFRDAYERAYRLGLSSTFGAGHTSQALLSPEESRWLESAVRHEARYFNRFLDQVGRGSSPAMFSKRIDMYAKTLESIFRAGQTKGQHPHVEIHWRVNPELENCPACLKLAAGGPYTKDTLPTTPRAGATPCKFNCGCELEFIHTDQVQVDKRRERGLTHKYALSKIRGPA